MEQEIKARVTQRLKELALWSEEDWVMFFVTHTANKALESGRLSQYGRIELPKAYEEFDKNFKSITADKNAKTVDREAAIRAIDAALVVGVFGGSCDDEIVEHLLSKVGGSQKAQEMRAAKSAKTDQRSVELVEAIKAIMAESGEHLKASEKFALKIRPGVQARLGLKREGNDFPSISTIKKTIRQMKKKGQFFKF
jgi:hypothetical protein